MKSIEEIEGEKHRIRPPFPAQDSQMKKRQHTRDNQIEMPNAFYPGLSTGRENKNDNQIKFFII
jgi:hypothetical protein